MALSAHSAGTAEARRGLDSVASRFWFLIFGQFSLLNTDLTITLAPMTPMATNGAVSAWWCEAREAGRIIWFAQKHGGDIPTSRPAWPGHKGPACCTSSIQDYRRRRLDG
jgi:hypothetical protein